jgi:hypothetical protein
LQLPRSLFDLSSATEAARTRVHREQAAATHQAAGSATGPKNPTLPPPPRQGPDHAADDHRRRRLQLLRSLSDPSSTAEAGRTRADREQAAAAHQTAGSATEPKIRHCHHHHGTTQITPQMTTNGADCSSHGRYSISQWCCRDWPCPSRPRAGRCDPPDCRKCHGAENPALPPPPRHDPDHAADDHQWRRLQLLRSLFDLSVVLPGLPALEWTESRPLRPTRLPEVPRNRKIRHCHHHHGTAQITPQMTTIDADCSSHGRYPIPAVLPRLTVLE